MESLVISLFMILIGIAVWIFVAVVAWRAMRAHERIADAHENLAESIQNLGNRTQSGS